MKLFNKCFNNLSAFNTVSVFSSTHRTAWISFKSYLCTFKKKRVMFSSSSSFQHFKARPSRHACFTGEVNNLRLMETFYWSPTESRTETNLFWGGKSTVNHKSCMFFDNCNRNKSRCFFLNTRRYLRLSFSIFWLLNMKDVACGDTTEKSKL